MAAVANAVASGVRSGGQQTGAPAPAAASSNTRWDVPEHVVDLRRTADGVSAREYVRANLLGKGGFARCYLYSDIAKRRQVAGKVIASASLTKQRHVEKLHTEIRIHRALDHRHIVRFFSSFESGAFIYIMLELCSNNTLMELVKRRKRLPEPEARYWCLQLLDAMRYMHANQVIHRDLKLGNLFINADMELRVGDFGLATWLSTPDERRRTLCGTPNYIAPEILEQPAAGHSFEVDTWSFGVILYTLLVGRPPFETASVEETYQRIRDCSFGFPADVHVSEPARDLISWILQKDPAARPTLVQVTQHDFFVAPGAMVPKRLPESSLTSAPSFPADELFPGAAIVTAQLSHPIAKAAGLRAAVQTAKQRAASGGIPATARVGPAEASRHATSGALAQQQGAAAARPRRVSAAVVTSSPHAAEGRAGLHTGTRPGAAAAPLSYGVAAPSSSSPLASQHARRAASASATHTVAPTPLSAVADLRAPPSIISPPSEAQQQQQGAQQQRGRALQTRPINVPQHAAAPPQLVAAVGKPAAAAPPAAVTEPPAPQPKAAQPSRSLFRAASASTLASHARVPPPPHSIAEALLRPAPVEDKENRVAAAHRYAGDGIVGKAPLRAPAVSSAAAAAEDANMGRVAPEEEDEEEGGARAAPREHRAFGASVRLPHASGCRDDSEDDVAAGEEEGAGDEAMDGRRGGAGGIEAMHFAGGSARADSVDVDVPARLLAAAKLRDSPPQLPAQPPQHHTAALHRAQSLPTVVSPSTARLVARRPPAHTLGGGIGSSSSADAEATVPPLTLTTRPLLIAPPGGAGGAAGRSSSSCSGTASNSSGTGGGGSSSSLGAPGPLDVGYYVYEGATPRDQQQAGDAAAGPAPQRLIRTASYFAAAGPASSSSASLSSAGGSVLPLLSPRAGAASASSAGGRALASAPLSSAGSALSELKYQSLASDGPAALGYAFRPSSTPATSDPSTHAPALLPTHSENARSPALQPAAHRALAAAPAPVASPSAPKAVPPPAAALNDTYRALCVALAAAPPSTPPLASAAAAGSSPQFSSAAVAMQVSPAAAGALPLLPSLASVYAWSDAPPTLRHFSHPASAAAAARADGSVWVTTWLDYTAKYGLGYLLSTGDVGVYFNDSTKILLRAGGGGRVEYTERSAPGAPPAAPQLFTLDAAPATLTKKVTLLRHFQGCLAEKWGRRRLAAATAAAAVAQRPPLAGSGAAALAMPAGGSVPAAPEPAHVDTLATAFRAFSAMAQQQQQQQQQKPAGAGGSPTGGGGDPAAAGALSLPVTSAELAAMDQRSAAAGSPAVFVKKWVRTRRAVLFRLSNRTLQVAFIDGSALLLGAEGSLVTLLDHAGGRVTMRVPEALAYFIAAGSLPASPGGSSGVGGAPVPDRLVADVCRRLRYSRDVLQQLTLQGGAGAGPAAATGPGRT